MDKKQNTESMLGMIADYMENGFLDNIIGSYMTAVCIPLSETCSPTNEAGSVSALWLLLKLL